MGVELRPRQRAFTHLWVVSATHVHGAGGIRLRREGLGGCTHVLRGVSEGTVSGVVSHTERAWSFTKSSTLWLSPS
jgi:hypothetical protein